MKSVRDLKIRAWRRRRNTDVVGNAAFAFLQSSRLFQLTYFVKFGQGVKFLRTINISSSLPSPSSDVKFTNNSLKEETKGTCYDGRGLIYHTRCHNFLRLSLFDSLNQSHQTDCMFYHGFIRYPNTSKNQCTNARRFSAYLFCGVLSIWLKI